MMKMLDESIMPILEEFGVKCGYPESSYCYIK